MQNILITGANRGIGLEITKQYLENGHRVWASYRSATASNELLALENISPSLTTFTMDVTKRDSVETAFQLFARSQIKFDLLFNNAGVIDWDDFFNVDPDSFSGIYQVNLVGAFLVTRNAISCLHQNADRKSRIVNLSSRLGSIQLRGETQLGGALAYQCSKSALNMLTRQTALELESLKISIISISPGWVKTDMGGSNAKYEIHQSVSMMRSVLDSLSPLETGIFIGEDGNPIPW